MRRFETTLSKKTDHVTTSGRPFQGFGDTVGSRMPVSLVARRVDDKLGQFSKKSFKNK